jgi:hypothetical protein
MGFNSAFKRLREEDRLRVFDNRVLRKIFGPKREAWSTPSITAVRRWY